MRQFILLKAENLLSNPDLPACRQVEVEILFIFFSKNEKIRTNSGTDHVMKTAALFRKKNINVWLSILLLRIINQITQMQLKCRY